MQIRAFASNPHSTSKQELNQSPLAFIETASEPGLDEALKRKDNIIRVRNAQISALWDELHTRQPWKNAIKGEDIVAFPEDAANTTRKLAVLGINTVGAAVLVNLGLTRLNKPRLVLGFSACPLVILKRGLALYSSIQESFPGQDVSPRGHCQQLKVQPCSLKLYEHETSFSN